MVVGGPLRPLLLESLAQAPGGQDLPPLTSRAVSSEATETPFTSRTQDPPSFAGVLVGGQS